MNDEQRGDIEFVTEGMRLLSDAKDFALVVLTDKEDGGTSTGTLVTSEWLLPFFRDELDLMYQAARRRTEGDE